jgi:drug/metabolite transporter (DMT)-like permease
MTEVWGVLAAVLSSALGGTMTRFLVNAIDPLAIGLFRFGVGFLLLLPVALVQGRRWPPRQDWLAIAALACCSMPRFRSCSMRP